MKLNNLLWAFFGLLILKYTAYPTIPLWLLLAPLGLYVLIGVLITYGMYYWVAPMFYQAQEHLKKESEKSDIVS